MAGALRKTMEYLGLAEVDEYADADGAHGSRRAHYDEHGEVVDGEWDAVEGSDEHGDDDAHGPADHTVDASEAAGSRRGYGRVTPLHPRSGLVPAHEVRQGGGHGSVRGVPAEAPDLRRITTIHPRTYNEAKSIGESFRSGVPVIMNLTDMSDADAKRLVDFSAGLVFGLRGSIERVTNKVFLLSPEHVTVTGDAPVAKPKSLFNQS